MIHVFQAINLKSREFIIHINKIILVQFNVFINLRLEITTEVLKFFLEMIHVCQTINLYSQYFFQIQFSNTVLRKILISRKRVNFYRINSMRPSVSEYVNSSIVANRYHDVEKITYTCKLAGCEIYVVCSINEPRGSSYRS